MKIGEIYGCLTVLDNGEEYSLSEQYSNCKKEYDDLLKTIDRLKKIISDDEKVMVLKESPSSSFMRDYERNPSELERIYKEYVDFKTHWLSKGAKEIEEKLEVHRKCRCKCGKTHYFDLKTIESKPKYCFYPMFISSRMTYSIKAQNATYMKRQKYEKLMNVLLVENRKDCKASEEFCGLWNHYKESQDNRKVKDSEEKKYTVEEWDDSGKNIGKSVVYAKSHLEALKKIHPDYMYELFAKSDIRNRMILCGIDYNFRVSNHYGNSAQNRTRLYKRVTLDSD